MKRNYYDPLDFKQVCDELSNLMKRAELEIKSGTQKNLYSLNAHRHLMELGWKIMLPLQVDWWPVLDPRLTQTPLLSTLNQTFNRRGDIELFLQVDSLEDIYFFGYAVVSGELFKTSFMVHDEPKKPIYFKGIVIDPFAWKYGREPEYYIGCKVTAEDIYSVTALKDNPLESFIVRQEEDEHLQKMNDYYLEVYKRLLGDNPNCFPAPLIEFAEQGNFFIPSQEFKNLQELESKGTVGGKKPIDIIREMNPGVDIPSGQELANMILKKQ